MNDEAFTYKIILLSLGYPGKTCLINRYMKNRFEENVNFTTSSSYQNKEVRLNNGKKIIVNLWDTSGCEKNMFLSKIFLKYSKRVIFLYDKLKKYL